MKGLLLKDLYYMQQSKKFLLIVIGVTAFLLMTQKDEGISFVIAYTMVMCQTLVLSTFTNDEFDRSITFLMAMPVDKKRYVIEKYIFSFGCGIAGWMFMIVICMIAWPYMAIDTLVMAAIVFVLLTIFQSIVLPIQIKFGGEKGRVVLLCIIMFVAALVYVLDEFFDIIQRINNLAGTLENLGPAGFAICGLIACVICVFLSVALSIHIMEKKEF